MKDRDYNEFLATMVALAEALGPKELSEAMLQMYWTALSELTVEQFRTASEVIVKTSKFFPKPAEFLAVIVPDLQAKAVVALDRTIAAIGDHGTYKTVSFDDPAINATVESMGGWIAIGEKDLQNDFVRKDFLKLYEVHAKRVRAGDFSGIPVRLVGRSEGSNITKGYKLEPPKIVGDERLFLEWTSRAMKPNDVQRITSKVAPMLGGPSREN